jgi:hypothetical protein
VPARWIDFLGVAIWTTDRASFDDDPIPDLETAHAWRDLRHLTNRFVSKIDSLDTGLRCWRNTWVRFHIDQGEICGADPTLEITHPQPALTGKLRLFQFIHAHR